MIGNEALTAVSVEAVTVVPIGEFEWNVRKGLTAPASSSAHVKKAFWMNREGPFIVRAVTIGGRKGRGSRFVERHRVKMDTTYVSGSE